MSQITRRIFAVVLAIALMLSSMSGAVTANAANAVVEITLDGTQNFAMASEVLAIINTERAAEGLAPLTADPVLMDYAMQRAAEVYLYYSHTRPDGTSCMTVFGEDYTYGSKGENIAMGQRDAATVMNAWMNSSGHRANILNSSYNSVGVGCFYQSDGSIAWVQLFHSNTSANSDSRTGVTAATGVKVKALSSNLVGHVQHHYFGDDTCAVYLYEGTTVNTDFCLINPMLPWVHPVEITSDNYTYTTSDGAVLSTDNANHTLIAAGVGVAQLGVQIDGADIYVMDDSGYINPTATVEVMPMPKLTYEIDEQGNIHVDYSGFNSVVTLFYKGINDELWTMGNREADGIYTHYYPDPTETYVYVMRYWDSDLEMYVELGERLIVKLGNEDPETEPTPDPDPEPEPEPDPDPEPEPEPDPSLPEIPEWDAEPTLEQAMEILKNLEERYPTGTEWTQESYTWLGGSLDVLDNNATGYDSMAFCMALSDHVFGNRPAKVIKDAKVNDLRPGDILIDSIWGNMIVMDMSQDYIYCATVADGNVQYHLFSPADYTGNVVYALVRYESDAPGAAAINPCPVPEDANVLASGEADYKKTYMGETTYYAIIRWTLDDEGNLYFYGRGKLLSCQIHEITGYDETAWAYYAQLVKRVIIGTNITEIDANAFEGFGQMEELLLSEGLREIGDYAFDDCDALQTVQFPKSLTAIGNYAFHGCNALQAVRFQEGLREIGDYAFFMCDLRTVEFPTSLTTIGDYAFAENGIETLRLPETILSLGKGAFSGNTKLVSLYIPATLEEMGDYAFSDCTALTELILEDGLRVLGKYAFSGCDSLKTVSLPGSLTEIPEGLFNSCGLETVYIGAGTQVICESAFFRCADLTQVHFPNTLTTIETYAFDHCEKLLDVYFYGSPEEWDAVELGTNNSFLGSFAWIHFMDPNQCLHQNVEVILGTAATCTQGGLTEGKICADCREVLKEQEATPALDHDWSQWQETVAPTEETAGQEQRTCCRCGETETRETDRLEHTHDYAQVVTEPTCTEDGCITYTCRCGHSYTEVLPKIAHSYVGGTCEHCGASESMPGDVNGDGRVNARDVRLLLRYAAGLAGDDEMDMAAADFNGDGRVNARDARALLRSIAGLA